MPRALNVGHATLRLIVIILGSILLPGTIDPKEDFASDKCFNELGRSHMWNLSDFYAKRRLNQTLSKALPRAFEKLQEIHPELFAPQERNATDIDDPKVSGRQQDDLGHR